MEASLIMAFKLILAGVLGGIVGYEREVHEHPAGLRTHILVCMGSTLITLVSISFTQPHSDPSRIAAQIVSGIGFLGAGTILRQGSIVRGLTTAASLWAVAGIGMAVGIGGMYYGVAIVATCIIFITLSTMRVLEPAFGKRLAHNVYIEMSEKQPQVLGNIIHNLTDAGIAVHTIGSIDPTSEDKRAYKLEIVLPRNIKPETVMRQLADEKGLDRFEWM